MVDFRSKVSSAVNHQFLQDVEVMIRIVVCGNRSQIEFIIIVSVPSTKAREVIM